ncbi:hypothetical protein ACFOLC_10205 [Lysobacter cavernae]|uniref:DUF1318 domain-containing protein n=1 Tax=Lysobacter cavernae TaxID=1685901 RepID=A0ABV7RU28_9GAMM
MRMVSKNRIFSGLLLALALSLSFAVAAVETAQVFDVATVKAKQDKIRRAMQSGTGGYQDLPAETRSELQTRQGALLQTIDGRTYADLSEQQRAEASQNIAWIDKVSQQAEDGRMICERVKPVGSNRTERVCKTAKQRREEREAARGSVENAGRGIERAKLD